MNPTPERLELVEGSWDDLLDFLDPRRHDRQDSDRNEVAESKYVEITRKLVCFFAGRGCHDPEDLAMTTVLRVAAKCGTIDSSGFGDPTGYFYGVARHVLHEAQRDSRRDAKRGEMLRLELARLPVPDPQSWQSKEAVQRCLDRCMARLTQRARGLLVGYYNGEGEQKIEWHRALAGQFGKSLNALRIEVHRVKKTLRECVFTCLHLGPGGAGPGSLKAPAADRG